MSRYRRVIEQAKGMVIRPSEEEMMAAQRIWAELSTRTAILPVTPHPT